MTPSPVRVRFAPAPTGYLHIGGARTALFNWLFARQHGGELILRIEDTDAERSRPELIEVIYDTLRWLGIDWDGEPVHQSERVDRYHEVVAGLLAAGRAYRCDCSQEQAKARAEARGGPPGYDGHCRDRDVAPGPGVVVRFRTPDEGTTGWNDVVRGEVSFENANLEDFVIVRSSGVPMFLVANAVDDADLGITHVIRGEDLINVTPKVLLLREAIDRDGSGGREPPVFAHLPLIVNEKRQKLSKRRDDVSVGDYRERGFLPEAMANYLATLGWGPPDGVEVRPMLDVVALFRLEDVNKASAFFDLKKLEHFNGEYLRDLAVADFATRSRPFLEAAGLPADAFDRYPAMAPLVQERVKRLDEVPGYVAFLFAAQDIDPASWKKVFKGDEAFAVLDDAIAVFGDVDWSTDALHDATAAIGERLGWGLGKTTGPIRVAVTGSHIGPPLFESLEALGRDTTLERLRAARRRS